jgi:ankyrin repeat protein
MTRQLQQISLTSRLSFAAVLFLSAGAGCHAQQTLALARLEVLGFETQGNAFAKATALKNERVVELFLRAASDPNRADEMSRTPLFHATATRDWPLAKRLLEAGADPKTPDREGVTPLMLTAAHGHLETIAALLERQAGTNAIDRSGRTALHYAIAARQFDAMQHLLNAGAPLDPRGADGRDAFAVAVNTSQWKFIDPLLDRIKGRKWDPAARSALQLTINSRDTARMRTLMAKHVGPPSPEGCKDPLLAYAVAANNLDLARLLLEAGTDPNTTLDSPAEARLLAYPMPKVLRHYLAEEEGMTVLMMAAGLGYNDMLNLLISKGAERYRPTRSKHRLVPLYFAAWGDHADCLQSLIDDAPSSEAVRVEVSLNSQRVTLYKNGAAALSADISSGRRGYATPTGRFVVTDKKQHHVSSIYKVKMPYFLRLSCRDFGLHEGYVPDYPASHGCIRVPADTARKLFKEVPIGTLVTITD